jgi:hypothetical protein
MKAPGHIVGQILVAAKDDNLAFARMPLHDLKTSGNLRLVAPEIPFLIPRSCKLP